MYIIKQLKILIHFFLIFFSTGNIMELESTDGLYHFVSFRLARCFRELGISSRRDSMWRGASNWSQAHGEQTFDRERLEALLVHCRWPGCIGNYTFAQNLSNVKFFLVYHSLVSDVNTVSWIVPMFCAKICSMFDKHCLFLFFWFWFHEIIKFTTY